MGIADEGAGSVGITLRFLAREARETGDAAFRNREARRGSRAEGKPGRFPQTALRGLPGAFRDRVLWPLELLDSS